MVDLDQEWGILRARYKETFKTVASPKVVYKTYTSIIDLLKYAAENCLSARRCEILKKRLFTNSPVSLQDIAIGFDVSRERIRQLQNSSWRRLSTGIYMYTRFVSYRESLKNILMSVPNDMLDSTIEAIYLTNKPIGEWLYMIVGAGNQNQN